MKTALPMVPELAPRPHGAQTSSAVRVAPSWATRSRAGILASCATGRTASARWPRHSASARTTSATTSPGCVMPASSARAVTAADARRMLLRARRGGHRGRAGCAPGRPRMTTLALRRVHPPFWLGRGDRHRRLAHRLDPAGAGRRLAHDRRAGPRHERGLRRGAGLLPLRPAQGDAAARRRRDARRASCARSSRPSASAARSRVATSWRARPAAAGFGIITPFCSCSAVPLFIGFVEAGVPLGRDVRVPRRLARWSTRSPWSCSGACSVRPSRSRTWSPACSSPSARASSSAACTSSASSSRTSTRSTPARPSRSGRRWSSGCATPGTRPASSSGGSRRGSSSASRIGALIHGYAPTDLVAQIGGRVEPARRAARGHARRAALRQRRGHDPDRRGAPGQGPADRHRARIHDGRHRAVDPRAAHPAPGHAPRAHRRVRRRRGQRHRGRRLPVQPVRT